jgi:tetratricopeptide (TPR) repeat protein
LRELCELAPDAYDFSSTYRELEKIYSKRDDSDALMARVHMGRALLAEHDGDLENALQFGQHAVGLAPSSFAVIDALVDLHIRMRRWADAVALINKFLEAEVSPEDRAAALLRQAEIHADGEMDSHRAISVLRDVIRTQGDNVAAHRRLAQELYTLGRYDEARQSISKAIELVTAPGQDMSPQELARYYCYLGRILEAAGDDRAAASQYRRAVDYDPAYAAPVLALAKRAAVRGDFPAAQTILINAAHAAIEASGKNAAVPLQRGLAKLQLAAQDPAGTIDAYRGILAVEPNVADRMSLAELYGYQDLGRAARELQKVVSSDIRYGPVYRELFSVYGRMNQADRAARVYTAMDLLGYAEDQDRALADHGQESHEPMVLAISDDWRERLLANEVAVSVQGELFELISGAVSEIFQKPPMGENLVPSKSGGSAKFNEEVQRCIELWSLTPDVYLGERVPGGAVVMSAPREIIVVDKQLAKESTGILRFILAFAFESIHSKTAVLTGLTGRQLEELYALLHTLSQSESRRSTQTAAFIAGLPKRAAKLIDDLNDESAWPFAPRAWIRGLIANSRRAGLVACDDLRAATRAIALLAGESFPPGEGGTRGLGAVICGEELVKYYLSDEFFQLRSLVLGN